MAFIPDDILLGLLAFRPQHGYQLLEIFRDPAELGCVWKLSVSQLYAVLKRMSAQGYITGEEMASANAPARVVYTIAPIGRERLYSWLHEPQPSASIRSVRVEFLSRLYIARLLNLPTIEIIRRQKLACRQERAARIHQRDTAPLGVSHLSLDLQVGQLDAILNWIDRCEMIPHDGEDL